jgi:hypothetical protein
MSKVTIKNPVAKNLAKLNKNAGAHGKTEKAKRRAESVAFQTQITEDLSSEKTTKLKK